MRLLRLVFIVEMHFQPLLTCGRYMAEILPIQRKTQFNPSITINIIISIVRFIAIVVTTMHKKTVFLFFSITYKKSV